MKTYIVLIPLNENNDARKQCEFIEGYKFQIGESVQASAKDIRAKVILLIDDNTYDLSTLEIQPISDFMDRVNNEQFNPDNYFISYVFA